MGKNARMFPDKSAITLLRSIVTQSTKMSAPTTTSRSPSTNPRKNVRLYRKRLRGRYPGTCATLYLRRTASKCQSPTLSTRTRLNATLLLNNSAPKYQENLAIIINDLSSYFNFYTNFMYLFILTIKV